MGGNPCTDGTQAGNDDGTSDWVPDVSYVRTGFVTLAPRCARPGPAGVPAWQSSRILGAAFAKGMDTDFGTFTLPSLPAGLSAAGCAAFCDAGSRQNCLLWSAAA